MSGEEERTIPEMMHEVLIFIDAFTFLDDADISQLPVEHVLRDG